MARGIDHLVLAVRDLDQGCAAYEKLGFTLTPRAQHPFGTGNRLAQLEDDFLEILSVTEPENLSGRRDGVFSFGAHNRDYLAKREGMSMIALKSDNWRDDRRAFSEAGLKLPEPFTFSRIARQPDGSEVTVGFDLTFVPRPEMPDAVFFTCNHQHAPECFYKPAFQQHANGAVGVDEFVMIAADEAITEDYLARLYGGEHPVTLLTGNGFDQRFPQNAVGPVSGAAIFGGYRVAVRELDVTRGLLTDNDMAFAESDGGIWLTVHGCVVEFSERTA